MNDHIGTNPICPACHQPIRGLRLGVRLPPLKARLVDLIKAAGELGVTARELRADLYRGYDQPRGLNTVRTHIGQINDLLEPTDWRIVADGRSNWARWYLRRRRRIAA